ncbi:LamG domain-containing protein, partial [Flavobacteriaceae sp. LMIT009]
MEKCHSLSKQIAIALFLCLCTIANAQDFKIQHVQDGVGNSGGTNTGFTAVTSLNNAVALANNNRKVSAGLNSEADTPACQGDDISGARQLTATNTLTYYRESGSLSDNMRFNTSIWEYIGPEGGANEFIVRGRYAIALNGTTNSTTQALSGVTNAEKCIPFITGIINDNGGDTQDADSGTAIAYLSDASTLNILKGSNGNDVTVYITVVEFTGSNWTVLHGDSGSTGADTGTITLNDDEDGTSGTATDVSDWSEAIIFTHHIGDTATNGVNDARADNWPILAPGSDEQSVDWTFHADHDSAGTNRHFTHVLVNPEMSVTRFQDTSTADGESTIDISSASITDESLAMVIGSSITSGTSAYYARGWRNYYFNSPTEIAHWCHRPGDGGDTMSHEIQIVNFDPPSGPGGVLTSLELWLKADEGVEEAVDDVAEDGDSVLNWLDNTINTNDASQSTGANQPTYNEAAINFNPAIDFDGTNHEMTASISANSQYTIFAVTEGTYSTTKTLLNLDNGANGSVDIEQTAAIALHGSYTDSGSSTSGTVTNDLTTLTSGVPQLINFRHLTGEKNRMLVNGILQTVAGSNTNANTLSGTVTAGIGADPSTSSTRWNGEIAEMIVYNYKVPVTERYRIESYLGIKYGITIGVNGTSQDYVDSDDRVIWDQSANAGYNYNITGIGKDYASRLLQKQSRTINTTDDITVGIKGIETTNQGNSTQFFSDKTFLIWGHNNGTTTAGTDITKDFSAGTTETNNLSVTPINRIWKMVVTDSVPTVKISIPETMVSAANAGGEDYVMIISDDAAFTTNVTSATMDDVGSELEVDWYFEGTKFITFGAAPETSLGSSSAYFDNYGATDGYLDAGDVNDLDGKDFTISAWVRRDTGENKFDIVSKRNYYNEGLPGGDSYTHGYAFRINQTGKFRMVWKDPDDTVNNQLETNETIPENEWHHVAATYDFSENWAVLYIDGIHVYDSDDYFDKKGFALNPMNTPSDAHFIIGAAHHIKRQQKLRGSVDEVRVWNVELSANQIRYIMNQEIEENVSLNADGKILPSTTTLNDIDDIPWNNLIAYYPMSNAVFGSIKDESNSGNDASMINYDNIDEQTAPLPYRTKSGGTRNWDDPDTWENGDIQYLPGVVSYLYESEPDADKKTMDYNIVQLDHDVDLDNSDTNLIPSYKNGNRTVLGLIVNSGELEIQGNNETDTGYGLTVSHYLKLDGKIDLEGESQLIQGDGSDLDVDSSGTLEKDQQGTADLYTYNYWAAPVGVSNTTTNNNSYALPNVMQDGTTSGTPQNINWLTSGYDGTSGSPVGVADYWVWKYANQTSDNYPSWQHVRSTGSLQAGEGFTMKGTTDTNGVITTEQNYVFEGKPHNGDITLTLSSGNDYLVGNPYASAIDADEFILDNISIASGGRQATDDIINGTLYFWDHFANESHYLSDYEGGYATYNLLGTAAAVSNDIRINNSLQTGTKEPGQYIPVGQGFFVTATDGGT